MHDWGQRVDLAKMVAVKDIRILFMQDHYKKKGSKPYCHAYVKRF